MNDSKKLNEREAINKQLWSNNVSGLHWRPLRKTAIMFIEFVNKIRISEIIIVNEQKNKGSNKNI